MGAAVAAARPHVDSDGRWLSGHVFAGAVPSASELELIRWRSAVDDLAELHGVAANEVLTSQAIWQDIAHAFFNLKEFLYYR